MRDVLRIKRIELKHSARKGVKTMIHQLMCFDDTFLPHCDIRLYFKYVCVHNVWVWVKVPQL